MDNSLTSSCDGLHTRFAFRPALYLSLLAFPAPLPPSPFAHHLCSVARSLADMRGSSPKEFVQRAVLYVVFKSGLTDKREFEQNGNEHEA